MIKLQLSDSPKVTATDINWGCSNINCSLQKFSHSVKIIRPQLESNGSLRSSGDCCLQLCQAVTENPRCCSNHRSLLHWAGRKNIRLFRCMWLHYFAWCCFLEWRMDPCYRNLCFQRLEVDCSPLLDLPHTSTTIQKLLCYFDGSCNSKHHIGLLCFICSVLSNFQSPLIIPNFQAVEKESFQLFGSFNVDVGTKGSCGPPLSLLRTKSFFMKE